MSRVLRVRRSIAALLFLVTACAAPVAPAAADGSTPVPIQIVAQPVALDIRDATRNRVGQLIYRGGVALTANDPRFGGWSDLDVSEDGSRITAISDRGFWFDAKVEYDGFGTIARLSEARLGYLLDLGGRRQPGLSGDAEGLTRVPDGSFIVSFERRHRVWLYPAAEPPFSIMPRVIPPLGASAMPENGGIEAIVRLAGGRVLVLSEELRAESGANAGWIGGGRTWQQLSYMAGPDFKPTGAARLSDGDMLVLERRFGQFTVPGARIARVGGNSIRPGARLVGTELALIEPPLTLDNFEGMSVRQGAGGETLIYLISDDNYFFLQRTLLLVFELTPE